MPLTFDCKLADALWIDARRIFVAAQHRRFPGHVGEWRGEKVAFERHRPPVDRLDGAGRLEEARREREQVEVEIGPQIAVALKTRYFRVLKTKTI